MAVNLCAAHKQTESYAAHEVLLACFLQSCITRGWISCSAQSVAHVLYTKVNSRTESLNKNRRTHACCHMSVNLDVSSTVITEGTAQGDYVTF